jgi:hypothetical protein
MLNSYAARVMAAVVGLFGLTQISSADLIDPSLTVSKGKYTTRLTGSGFIANGEARIFVVDPDTGVPVDLGTVLTDKSGNFSDHWLNLSSTAAAIKPGLTIQAVQGSTTVSVVAKKDFSLFLWTFASLGTNVGPLQNQIVETELASAGFTGNVDLVGISSNATIVSEETTFASSTDTITTNGFYDLLALGPVDGIYEATGSFTSLFDPATGLPITAAQDLFASEQLGTVVPEPASFTLLGLAFLSMIHRMRRTQS